MGHVGSPPPDISFAFFEPVVVDLVFATYIDLVPFLAHEVYPYYKGQLHKMTLPEPEHSDFYLLRSIRQRQTEGVADLIVKRPVIDSYTTIGSDDSWYERTTNSTCSRHTGCSGRLTS